MIEKRINEKRNKMKIRQYIKRMATLSLMVALLAPLQEAWGQVKGNRYKTSVTVVKKYYAAIEDDNNTELQKAFDGDREKTWWDAASAGPKTITIELETDQRLASVNYYGGGNETNVDLRPSEVQVYYSSNGYKWNPVQTFSNIDRTVRDRTLTITENNRVSAKFYRLVLVPGFKDDGSYQTLAMNEITLYSQGGGKIDVPSPDEETIGNLADKTIIHKHPKWFELRDGISTPAKNMDTFNDDIPTFGPPEDKDMVTWTGTIQAAHTYIDTIYMHPGTSVTLTLPDKLNDVSVRGYQRWYSFRTDGTYRTNNTGQDVVWDLLTPTVGTSYRFANGYVSKPIDTNANGTYQMNFYFPKEDEFNSWFPDHGTLEGNWFVVACDVSGYNDYTKSFNEMSSESDFLTTLYEPTLTHRVLYYIASVDGRTGDGDKWENGHGRLSDLDYQGGGNAEGKKYLEEYEISFPYTRLSNTVVPTTGPKTTASPEQVALSKDARAYAIPDLPSNVSDTDELTVTLIDGNGNGDEEKSGIELIEASTYKVGGNSYRNYTNVQSLTISGENRVIQFAYPTTKDNGTQSVLNNNSTATILVTKTVGGTTYNIARFKLNFVADTRLLTQTQLQQIENGTIKDETMKYYQFRTPEYLEEHYQLLTSLNWDYDPDVAGTYGQNKYYPFPMAWDYSSYSFFDGAPAEDFVKVSYDMPSPEWGYYAIMNDFVEDIAWAKNDKASLLPNSTYHLYVDASDRPGVIANLPFRQPLCKGSELFVTAWVKSAGYSEGTPDAGMLFTIMGVEADGTKVPLYSHSSSQIRRTDYLKGGLPGTGGTTNEWLQVYFSFINKSDVTYQTYELQVSNNSESTQGGDMYLDDVRVYMATPSATVSQLEATCASERTRMNIKMDWERLLSRTGAVEGTGGERAIDFCFIDQLLYNQYIKNHASDPLDPTDEEIAEAIAASVQDIGDGETFNDQFVTLNYKLNYDSNRDYNDPDLPQKGDNKPLWGPLAINNKVDGKYYAYRLTDPETNVRNFAVDFYSKLSPNRMYWMLINTSDGTTTPNAKDFVDFMTDCAIKTEFRVTALNLVKVNGEILNPGNEFCAGQHFDFSVSLRIPVTDGEETKYVEVSDGINFDWFFGTEEEFIEENEAGVSLQEALLAFRAHYKDAEQVDENTPIVIDEIDEDVETPFTQAMFDLIKKNCETGPEEGGRHNKLVLCKPFMPINLLSSGLNLVIQPIQTKLPEGVEGITDKQWALVCWDHIVLNLVANGEAPRFYPGFDEVAYPGDGTAVEPFHPNIRIGLKQITAMTSDAKTFHIDLRETSLVTEGADYAGLIDDVVDNNSKPYMTYLYLADTDDPDMKDWLTPISDPDDPLGTPEFDQFSLPIGVVTDLQAKPYDLNPTFDSFIKIYFDLNGDLAKALHTEANSNYKDFVFKPREGYYYTFTVHFKEVFEGETTVSNACFGSQNLTMKVVPEYMEWTGQTQDGKYANWNNDENWQRVSSERIKKVKDKTSDYFTDGTNGTTNGFVPMLFTKVIMPENSQVELYAAGYNGTTSIEWDTNRPTYIAAPTENIQYDLMAFESGSPLKTERYRVSLLDEIHFEPGAEMKHAEYLLYNKAWVDYKLDGGRWYTLASPLQGVVAGDFYTDSRTGKEGSEYFQNITFSTTDNNRFNPSVYQRAWKGNATLITTGNNSSGTSKDVAVSGNWSALYNDVTDAYTPGTGFSLKVQDLTNTDKKALFRLPKADEGYSYYSQDGVTGPSEKRSVSRYKPGRLRSDTLFTRNTDITNAKPGGNIVVQLDDSYDGTYYLVGNPFMAHLDMKAFFDSPVNAGISKTYWVVNKDNQWVGVGGENGLVITGEGTTVAPLQSFFIKKDDRPGATTASSVTFTADMQVLGSGTEDGLRSADALMITATTDDGRQSRAAVAYSGMASDDYQSGEDAELFLDSNLGDVPMVYTVAGTMATSINVRQNCELVPLGVYGTDDEPVTLRFDQVDAFSGVKLYDAQTKRYTTLTEGSEVSVSTNDSGRYYLTGGLATGSEAIRSVDDISIYSVRSGEIVATSAGSSLRSVRVYGIGGELVTQQSLANQSVYRLRVPGNAIYVVYAEDMDGIIRNVKLRVR